MKPRSQGHRSTRFAPQALAVACAVACSKSPMVTTRTVTVNVPTSCKVDGKGDAVYAALGDFEPPTTPLGPTLAKTGVVLTQVDQSTRELVVTVGENSLGWEGLTPVPASGDVNVMVLPDDLSCTLTQGVGQRPGAVLGAIGGARVLLAGGQAGSLQAFDVVLHLDTGAVVTTSHPLHTPRTVPTVTPFGPAGLVAGGLDFDGPNPIGTAEVFDASADAFTATIMLAEPRAGHAAVVLVDGRTLLVGGYTDGMTTAPVASMEIVDPASKSSTQAGVARLSEPLAGPVAVVLASGEVLVAGESTSMGTPVTGLEWFKPDASRQVGSMQTIPAGAGLALVALEGGGALAVVAPPPSAPAGFETTWVISADYAVSPATPVPGNLDAPVLFGGAGGAPLLWTGDRWLQWQPWSGAFGPAPVLDTSPANIGDAFTTADPGLAMWLDFKAGQLVALRTDTSNAYTADATPFALDDATGLAPDRLPGPASVTFTGGTGLTMSLGASAFVTDRSYADVSVQVTAGSLSPPAVIFRDATGVETTVDATCCGVPTGQTPAPGVATVERHGSNVTCAVGAAPARPCSSAPAAGSRVAVGVRGTSATIPSIAQKIVVQRLGEP